MSLEIMIDFLLLVVSFIRRKHMHTDLMATGFHWKSLSQVS